MGCIFRSVIPHFWAGSGPVVWLSISLSSFSPHFIFSARAFMGMGIIRQSRSVIF